MTFARFEELFLSKYTNGEVFSHGEMSNHVTKTSVVFNKGGKVYDYKGSYVEILNKVGINVISKETLKEIEKELDFYKENDGQEDIFFDDEFAGEAIDYSKEIKELEEKIANLKENYIIV